MRLKTFTIWRDPEGDFTLVEGTNPPRLADEGDTRHGCVMVHRFEAKNLTEAVDVLHRWHEREQRGNGQ